MGRPGEINNNGICDTLTIFNRLLIISSTLKVNGGKKQKNSCVGWILSPKLH